MNTILKNAFQYMLNHIAGGWTNNRSYYTQLVFLISIIGLCLANIGPLLLVEEGSVQEAYFLPLFFYVYVVSMIIPVVVLHKTAEEDKIELKTFFGSTFLLSESSILYWGMCIGGGVLLILMSNTLRTLVGWELVLFSILCPYAVLLGLLSVYLSIKLSMARLGAYLLWAFLVQSLWFQITTYFYEPFYVYQEFGSFIEQIGEDGIHTLVGTCLIIFLLVVITPFLSQLLYGVFLFKEEKNEVL